MRFVSSWFRFCEINRIRLFNKFHQNSIIQYSCELKLRMQVRSIKMIEEIKKKLWDLLEKKRVSLVMIYNRKGEILWHRGRKVIGKSVEDGSNFCKSFVLTTINELKKISKSNVSILHVGDGLSESAERLMIKSVLILPINQDHFLYVDSGTKVHFTEAEQGIFQILADLLQAAIDKIRKSDRSSEGICGKTAAMEKVKNLILKYSFEEECVLILGETGVGKSYIAERIHQYSGRPGGFVVADTATINENLFESVVFGHKKGAFTGATDDRKGLVDVACTGTLFFDEVTEVPLSFQAKLLRFIETKQYRVLGEAKEKNADVRIIAATNRDLPALIQERKFREDLYYRLNILEIQIPPIRERKADIELLIRENRHFLKGKETGAGFEEAMLNHHWPGNVRELITVLKRLGILYDPPLTGVDVRSLIGSSNSQPDIPFRDLRLESIWSRLENGESFWQAVKEPFLQRHLNRIDVKAILDRALNLANGKYINTLTIFNLEKSEYKPFMRFLNHNKF